MVNITLAIPDEIKKEMENFPEMNWSVIAREAIKKRIEILKAIREFTKESELTEEDALRLGRKVSEGLSKRYRKK